jgi:hypothetical protein
MTSLFLPRAWRPLKALPSLRRWQQLLGLPALQNQPAPVKRWWVCHSQRRSAQPERQKCFLEKETTYERNKPGIELCDLQALGNPPRGRANRA